MNTIKQLKWLLLLLITTIAISCDTQLEMPPYPEYKPLVMDSSSTFNATFDNELGNFTVKSVSGESKWALSKYKYVLMNGKSENANEPNEDWLISPAIQLPMLVTSVLSFDFAAREFASISDEFTIWISEDYKPELADVNGTWNQVQAMEPFKNTADWNLVNSGDISLKLYKGKKVYIAIKYISTINSAGILQIKNVTVKDRKPVALPYSEAFSTSKGKFIAINVLGAQVWAMDRTYIKMSGFVGSSNIANEDWLISPQVDLTKVTKAKMSFDYVTRYFGTLKNEATVWISRNYEEGAPTSATWTQIKTPLPLTDKGSWDFSKSGEINLTEYAGDTITVAFKYLSTATKAGTWEIKNFTVVEGEPIDYIFVEGFDATLGRFTAENKLGTQNWYVNTSNQYAIMSGFANSVSNTNEDWLISPAIDLTGKTTAKINFDHTINKGLVANMITNHTLWLSADNGTTWEQVTITVYPKGNDWNFVNSGDIVIPEKFLGKSTFKFAFKYLCSTAESASWEIRNVVVKP
jgi:hypothetical protein